MAQAALVGDILAAVAEEQALDAMLARCAKAVVRRLGTASARVWTLDAAGDVLELQASAGMYSHLDGEHSRVPVGQFEPGWPVDFGYSDRAPKGASSATVLMKFSPHSHEGPPSVLVVRVLVATCQKTMVARKPAMNQAGLMRSPTGRLLEMAVHRLLPPPTHSVTGVTSRPSLRCNDAC